MPTPFDTLTVRAAQGRLAGAGEQHETAESALKFAKGDHWQEGHGWSGPCPDLHAGPDGQHADHQLHQRVLHEIRRAFVSKNVIHEVEARHIAGVIGNPVAWRLTVARPLSADELPSMAELALIAEAEATLTTWWDAEGVAEELQEALTTLLCAGRAPLRLYVPPGLLVEGADGAVSLPPGDLAAQLGRIVLDAPDREQATVITDRRTRQRAGVFLAEEERGQPTLEVSAIDGAETVLRIVAGDVVQSETRLPLGGRLLVYDMERPALITAQVLSLQKLLNLALTMLARNVILGGFLERVYLNTQMPGELHTDPRTGKEVFVPYPFDVGAGSINVLQGTEIRDEVTGQVTGRATPSVVYRDPVSVQTFADTRDIAYAAILEECQQAHALLSGEAAPSGESRRQALADFLSSLKLTAPQVERAVRWLLETALHLAAHFAGQGGRYLGLRVVATCRLDTGPLSADEAKQVIDLVDARLLSRETGMARVGIDDSDAEAQRIQAEQEADATVGQTAINSFNSGQ
jgi:hypothetical protein